MSEELDASVGAVLADMPVIPAEVRIRFLDRLSAISDAIDKDMLDAGTTFLAFEDLTAENVVIIMSVQQHFAHLDISTADEGVIVSNGYDFLIGDRGVTVVVNAVQKNQLVDHVSLLAAHRHTDVALANIERARDLMLTSPIFKRA